MPRFNVAPVALVLLAAPLSLHAADGGAAGPPARDAMVAVVQAHLPEVSGCYQKALLRAPWLAGRLVVNFAVDASGAVTRAEIERTELPDVRFLACAQDAVKSWRFPASGAAPAELSYPFVLGASGSRDPSVLVDGRARPAVLPARCTQVRECRELGLGLSGGSEPERVRAFGYLETGCKQGDAASCAGVAAALDFGRGVAKDKRRAFASYQRACARGDQGACTAVAMSHALGVEGVVKRDPARGAALLERSCAAADGPACLNLAERLATGVGLPVDAARAADVRRRALERAGATRP